MFSTEASHVISSLGSAELANKLFPEKHLLVKYFDKSTSICLCIFENKEKLSLANSGEIEILYMHNFCSDFDISSFIKFVVRLTT